MATYLYNINEFNKWKLSPITSLAIKFTEGSDSHIYQFDNLKKGSKFEFNEIREPNDLGGFNVIAYEIIVEVTPVQLVQNYYDKFLLHCRSLIVDTIGIGFGNTESGYLSHALNFVATSPTILNISIENLSVKTSDEFLETEIKVNVIASIDLITDINIIFNNFS